MAYFTINAPCATTTSTTSTTTLPVYTVYIYARWANTPTVDTAYVYWGVQDATCPNSYYINDSTSCDLVATLSVTYLDYVYVGFTDDGLIGIDFNADTATSNIGCPSNAANYCGCAGFSHQVVGLTYILLSAYTDGSGFAQQCI
jgi:hypothetical protein